MGSVQKSALWSFEMNVRAMYLNSNSEDNNSDAEIASSSDSEESIPERLEYPETVQFEGVVYSSLKQVHISAFLIILVGALVAYANPLVGLPLLIVFLILVLGIEAWMIRKSRKQLRLTLHLREDPVEATQGSYRVGAISTGSLDTEMDNPNELGFRPEPKRSMFTWTFDSVEDKEIVAKRLLEYLPRDSADSQ
jgi:hypothetical protein